MPTAPAATRTHTASNRMSMDPSRNSTQRMSIQAVNPRREDGDPNCRWCDPCSRDKHWPNQCHRRPRQAQPAGQDQGKSRVQWRGPAPQRQEHPQEEEHPRQVQQVAPVLEHPPQETLNWDHLKVAACEPLGSAFSSGVRNIGYSILLNLEVDPGSKDLNSLMGIAVCYDTGQMTN